MSKFTEATNDYAMKLNPTEEKFVNYMVNKYWGNEDNKTAFRCGIMAAMYEMKRKDDKIIPDYKFLYPDGVMPIIDK